MNAEEQKKGMTRRTFMKSAAASVAFVIHDKFVPFEYDYNQRTRNFRS